MEQDAIMYDSNVICNITVHVYRENEIHSIQ